LLSRLGRYPGDYPKENELATKTLTTVGIKAIRPGSKRREIKDGGASHLYLIVQRSGQKGFAMRFRRPDGKTAKLVLGPFDPSKEGTGEPVIGQPLTLAAARHLAADIERERARGKDVIAERKKSKVQGTNNFAQAARDFIENHAKPKTRGWRGTSAMLGIDPDDDDIVKGGLADRWGERPIAEIDASDIYTITEEARARGIPGRGVKGDGPSENRARHLFSALSKMFSWLHRHRRVELNPCAAVHPPDPGRSRDRVLTNAEIVKFWKACDIVGEPFGSIFELLLLTGCRLNEVAGMRSAELEGNIWTIPGSRTKNHRPHIVPLPKMASDLIIVPVDSDLVFTTTGTSPVSGWSKSKARLDRIMGEDIPPWRLHDLRRTAATGMATIGIAPHIVEAVINHISGAKAGVAGIYNRATYLPEKTAALERWASHVAGLTRRGRKKS
jgi:integrase